MSVVLAFTGCTIEVVESSYALDYDYRYTSWCEDGENCIDAAEGGNSSSYIRVSGDLVVGGTVTIETYLPRDRKPNYKKDFVYKGFDSDELGSYRFFVAVDGSEDAFYIYGSDYAILEGFWDEDSDDIWTYDFSNDVLVYKKAPSKRTRK